MHIILGNNKQYFDTSKPFEITNALSAVMVILKEYSIANTIGESNNLYKTKDGDCDDISEEMPNWI
ncbi:MAG TPA: hypothetical protein VIL78_12825 [Hanamia sp.]